MEYLRLTLVVLALFSAAGRRASAQGTSLSDSVVSASLHEEEERSEAAETYYAGRQLLRAGQSSQAVRLLHGLFEKQAAYSPSLSEQPVAYWLGRAYRCRGEAGKALAVWEEGIKRIEKGQRRNLLLADVYLRSVLDTDTLGRERVAARAYRSVISHAGASSLAPDQWKLVRPYVARLGLLLSPSVRRQAVEGGTWEAALREKRFASTAGQDLLAWWRRQDPDITSPTNERLVEHLRRLVHVSNRYVWDGGLTGLDGRGETYLRFGPPRRTHTIRFNEADFVQEVLRFGIGVSRGDFPRNEIWTYQNIDEAGRYIFIDRGQGEYQLATAPELLPQRLRRHFANTKRGQNHAYSSLMALRYIYEALSLHYSDFGNLYDKISSYVTRQDYARRSGEQREWFGQSRLSTNALRIGEGQDGRTVYANPSFGEVLPSAFVSEAVQQSQDQDRELARRRAAAMPQQHTQIGQEFAPLPVHVRTARFLEEDGTTRTEVYWSISVDALRFPEHVRKRFDKAGETPGAYHLINLAVFQTSDLYEQRSADRKRYIIERGNKEGFMTPQTVAMTGATGPYHLSLQWEQRPARVIENSGVREARPGPKTHQQVYWVDSLSALPEQPRRLAISDLRPMTVNREGTATPEEAMLAGNPLEHATAYPYRRFPGSTPLLLSFEVYHLGFGTDDRTRYTVEYEVYRQTEKGGMRGLFGGKNEQRTSTSSTYQGLSSQAQEMILLDLGKRDLEREGLLRITVYVRDEVTGQEVQRSIHFETFPGAS